MTEITYPFDRMVPEGSSVMEVAPGILWLLHALAFRIEPRQFMAD